MRQSLLFIIQLVLILSIFSCKVSKQAASKSSSAASKANNKEYSSTSENEYSAENYINTYKDLAINEMKRTGIPASITLAQGMIESDYGRSRLAREANNHFGIKCHNDWKGPTIRHDDDKKNDCFRKYPNVKDSFYDHSDFLKSGSRYVFLFDIDCTDYKAWAHGLKKAGYATNPDYADMLIKNIEEYNLYYYDKGRADEKKVKEKGQNIKEKPTVREKTTVRMADDALSANDENLKPVTFRNGGVSVAERVQRVKENNRIQYIIVKDGDTLEKLEDEFQLLRWELPKYNEVKGDFRLVPGQILYLQPKREKAEAGKEYHNVAEGETMYLISQYYGIKLKKLYELNRMKYGDEPEAGAKIWLRSIKPANLQ